MADHGERKFGCEVDYFNVILNCIENEFRLHSVPHPTVKHCPPYDIANATLSTLETAYLTHLNVTCEDGYLNSNLELTTTTICQDDATWSVDTECICKRMCDNVFLFKTNGAHSV